MRLYDLERSRKVNDRGGGRSSRRDVSVGEILELHARVSGDIFEVDGQTWAIHGFIPVDGEVILAEFDGPHKARFVLDQIAESEDRVTAAPSVPTTGTVASAQARTVTTTSQREPATSRAARPGTTGVAPNEAVVGRRSDGNRHFSEPPDGLLTAPENRVLAFMDTTADVAAAIDHLVVKGFPPERIFVLCGPKGAERLDASGNRHGLRGRIYRIMEWMGDERDVLLGMEKHLSGGGLIVTVPADDASKAAAARALAAHGGHEMAHFGKRHWERLGP